MQLKDRELHKKMNKFNLSDFKNCLSNSVKVKAGIPPYYLSRINRALRFCNKQFEEEISEKIMVHLIFLDKNIIFSY